MRGKLACLSRQVKSPSRRSRVGPLMGTNKKLQHKVRVFLYYRVGKSVVATAIILPFTLTGTDLVFIQILPPPASK
jgi:hypothetical protein